MDVDVEMDMDVEMDVESGIDFDCQIKLSKEESFLKVKNMFNEYKKNRKHSVFIDEILNKKDGFYYTSDEINNFKKWNDLTKDFKKLKIIDYCSSKKIKGVDKNNVSNFTYKNIVFYKNNITDMRVEKK